MVCCMIANLLVQATLVCAFCNFLRQVPSAPDRGRSATCVVADGGRTRLPRFLSSLGWSSFRGASFAHRRRTHIRSGWLSEGPNPPVQRMTPSRLGCNRMSVWASSLTSIVGRPDKPAHAYANTRLARNLFRVTTIARTGVPLCVLA